MKTLLFVGKDVESNVNYIRELKRIFSGYLQIEYCYEAEQNRVGEDMIRKADIILLTNPYSLPQARQYLKKDSKIINMNFTFKRELVEALKRFPVGTEALVCFKYYSDAHQAAFTLYELGVNNLNLYINYENNKNLINKTMDIAIVNRDTNCASDGIPIYFDIGSLSIAVATIVDVAVSADIMCDEIEARIIRHGSMLSIPEDYKSYFFDNSAMANAQLRTITNCIEYGIVIVDEIYNIINCNNQFLSMFNIGRSISHLSVSDIPELSHLLQYITQDGYMTNMLIETPDKNRFFLFSKEKINKSDATYSIFMLLFKDVTEIHALESTFQKQIIKKGHVAKYTFDNIIHESNIMDLVIERCKKLAQIDKPTLIIGESGTGKELFAHSIHNASIRSKFPFVALNCATIPATLLESELFGYEEGAFTGAKKGGKIGLFQTANKGTLFLDEIGEITPETQAKLLRVLEENEIMRVGGDEIIKIDTKIIAATNRNLKLLVEEGSFRLDLYYRLNTLMVNIPPLRDRVDDLPHLINFFMRKEGKDIRISDELMRFFKSYQWEGNIRELRNCIEYMVNICDDVMDISFLPEYLYDEYAKTNTNSIPTAMTDISVLNSEEIRLEKFILKAIQRFALGRRRLLELLHNEGFGVSEYSLRNILKRLNENNYIVFGHGRAGCHITRKGEEYLAELTKER